MKDSKSVTLLNLGKYLTSKDVNFVKYLTSKDVNFVGFRYLKLVYLSLNNLLGFKIFQTKMPVRKDVTYFY